MTMRDQILGLPGQLRWAAGQAQPSVSAPAALLTGMGGSAMACDVASLTAVHHPVPVHRGYGLPPWAKDGLVVAVSYSGNTEETLSSVEAAMVRGLTVAVVASGGRLVDLAADNGWPHVAVPAGLQPRAALGYLAGGALRVIEGAGLIPSQVEELEEAATVVESLLTGGEAWKQAEAIADRLDGKVAVIYGGSGPSAVAARRWKTQINENAKRPAFWSELPELDHNEIMGWSQSGEKVRPYAVVLLRDPADHPRVRLRMELTRELIAPRITVAGEVRAFGNGLLARLFSLIVVGDALSLTLAERAGIDPVPVATIEELKLRLQEA